MYDEVSQVDTRVTPALHYINVSKVDGYDADTASVLSRTEGAFRNAYQQLIRVNDACEAARADPTLTEGAALVKSQDFADRTFQSIAKGFDDAAANLKVVISNIEREFAQPVESRATTYISAEIRAYIAKLPTEKRSSFVQKAIEEGDTTTASAALGAPGYLSGLTTEMHSFLHRRFHEHADPLKAKQLKAAKAGLDLLGERSGLIFKQIEQAVGAPRAKVEKHRAAAARTAKAFGA